MRSQFSPGFKILLAVVAIGLALNALLTATGH